MYCLNCGIELPNSAKFCGKCGAKTLLLEKTNLEHIQNMQGTVPTALLASEQPVAPSGDKTELLVSEQQNIPNTVATEMLFSEHSVTPSDDKTELLVSEKQNISNTAATEMLFSEQPVAPSGDKTEMLFTEQHNAPTEVKPENNAAGIVPLASGEMLGGVYRVIDIIGKGGFGYVYKAYHTRLEQAVVIKQIHRLNKSISNRTEADVLKRIKHTYLPQVHDFIEKDGTAFTIMDFISGADIDKSIKQGRKFRQKEIVRIAVQLCEAVKYLHSCEPPIIHSDIKPENIMLTENGDICLIDMNVSLIFDSNASLIGGTPDYAPPEQFGIPLGEIRSGVSKLTLIKKDTPRIDERSDIYSIGASLYYIALGKVPATDYITDPIADFAAAGISDSLASIVAKAMSLNPAKRYKSAAEMLTALNNLGKLDRRYKLFQIQRAVVTSLCAAMAFAFVSISRMGYDRMKEEHEEKYQGYVLQIENSIRNGDYDTAEKTIALAKSFEPSRIEPYLNEAKLLSIDKDYEACMEYPKRNLTADINNNERNDREDFAQIYEIAANGAFELGYYNEAVQSFQEALGYSPKITECYRDLTISYARLGNMQSAEDSLKKAREIGISDDHLDLMQGEISAANGDFAEAFKSFSSALQKTSDDYVRFRALLACDKAALANGQVLSAMQMVALLESEKSKVSSEYYGTVREMLANEYSRCGEFMETRELYQKAADLYGELMDEGILSYQLKKNYFNIMYTQLSEYNECEDLLDNMWKENSADYWIPMNRAYLEITVQNQIADQSQRDYGAAYKSYLQAEELYKTYTQNGKSDPNMDTLRSAIDILKNFGWIKET